MAKKITSDIKLGFFNSRIARPGMQKTDEHVINEYELEFCDTDGGVTYIDGRAYPVIRGMIICAKPGQTRWTHLPFCCYYIKIPSDNFALAPILGSMKESWITRPEKMELFLQSFHKLVESEERGEMRYYSAILSLLLEVAEDSEKSEQRRENKSRTQADMAVRTAEKYMDKHLGEKCPLEAVAKEAGFSPIYFHKLYKSARGMTPNEYLLSRRLHEAEERLSKSDATLSEVAFSCGFGSQSYFQYVFRRERGMTPTEYRKAQQQKYLS